MRRIALICAAGLTLSFNCVPTQAQSSPVVPIPGHPASADLTLLGASDRGVTVRQIDPADPDYSRVFTGPERTELTHRIELDRMVHDFDPPQVVGQAGGVLGWSRRGWEPDQAITTCSG